jgi:hypothetical protein
MGCPTFGNYILCQYLSVKLLPSYLTRDILRLAGVGKPPIEYFY